MRSDSAGVQPLLGSPSLVSALTLAADAIKGSLQSGVVEATTSLLLWHIRKGVANLRATSVFNIAFQKVQSRARASAC
jgi:hypothetical protein